MEDVLNRLQSSPNGIEVCRYLRSTAPGLALFALLFAPVSRAEDAFSVGFLNPTIQSASPFYVVTEQILQAAAQDLDIRLHVTYGKNSSIKMRQEGLKLLKTIKPDYFLTGYYKDATEAHLDYTLNNPTKIFLTNTPPPAGAAKSIGTPRKKYENFIGQLTHDNQKFGYLLADNLITMARQAGLTDEQNRVNIIAFGGFNDDDTSDARISGLRERIDEHKDVALLNMTLAGWDRDLAYNYTLELLEKYPSIHVIWSVNDDMAIGCIKAAETAGRHPGKDILIGGIDLNEEAIDYIMNGKQAVSIGGHFLQAAWSLVMLYDYHHGADFANNTGFVFHTEPYVLTADNVSAYKNFFLNSDWDKIDFRWFSKKLNPDIGEYNFSVPAFQKIIEEHTTKAK